MAMLLPAVPDNRLRSAMRYAILGGAKRLRPFFVIEVAKLLNADAATALDVACALECVHCYSLVHDDLPAMDDDALRRGRPTTHIEFDEATAILAGDGLLTFAFEILGRADVPLALVAGLAQASGEGGMVGGQMLDIAAETTDFSTLAAISDMQRKKTGALFAFACTAPAVLVGHDATALRRYAQNIGLAFQIADDVLDLESSPALLGKATQKDARKGKATFVTFLGLAGAKLQAANLVEKAIDSLNGYGEKADVLREAARFMITRRT